MATGGDEDSPKDTAEAEVSGLLFARSMDTGALVSIRDIPRGLACRCECPECGRRLIARQGERAAWHFAHQMWDGLGTPSVCRFGLYSSLRAMAIQALSAEGTLLLPDIQAERAIDTVRGGSLVERFEFRPTITIQTGPALVDARWQAQVGDVCFRTGGYTLSVVFLYPGRSTEALMDVEGYGHTHCVLGIEITELAGSMTVGSDQSLLESQLRGGALPCRWLYHPNLLCCEQEVGRRLRLQLRDSRVGHYHGWCHRCEQQWLGNGPVSGCPGCGAEEAAQLEYR